MTIDDLNLINSILTVKASGVDCSVQNDLNLPEGKSIAELLHDETNQIQQTQENCSQNNQNQITE